MTIDKLAHSYWNTNMQNKIATEFCTNLIFINDGHVLHLRSEIIAINRWMNMVLSDNDGQMIPGKNVA